MSLSAGRGGGNDNAEPISPRFEQIWLCGGAACVRDGEMVDIHWVSEDFRDQRN
jgi:hypothetical protein